MSGLLFEKWQGAGNDFILIDNRDHRADGLDQLKIRKLCDRHFGIGSDGLILLSDLAGYDFRMVFFNPDGNPADMCGNGGRCIAAMAYRLGTAGTDMRFMAPDGPHEAHVIRPDWIRLKMKEVEEVNQVEEGLWRGVFLNTGVPHLVLFVDEVHRIDVEALGPKLRFDPRFAPAGTNVNFVEASGNILKVRTYERGVENETLACGTGNIAAAVAAEWRNNSGLTEYTCQAVGGTLKVSFNRLANGSFTDIWLEGAATKVFEGTYFLELSTF